MKQSAIIMEEIKRQKLPRAVEEALAELLLFERESIDQKQPRFKEKYRIVVESLSQ